MRCAVLIFAALPLVNCSILEDDVARGYAQRDSLTPATFTTADVRMITQRRRPYSHDTVMCTEPSPDVAKALSAAAQLSGSGGNAGTTGSLAAGGASAEAVIALAGRSTALLGLRDGLYRACEAYANGAIGADAYALVLSRYGQLMTTLFLGQDVTGAAGTNPGASVQSPQVAVNLSSPPAVAAGSPPAGAPQIQLPPPPEIPAVAPVALTRMNEDYLNLGYNLDALVIACVNYADPTRLSAPVQPDTRQENHADSTSLSAPAQPETRRGNWWLDHFCLQILDLPKFSDLANAAGQLVKNQVLAPPVNPAAMQSPQKKSTPKIP
jgi:hypothetical protein